jgi:hypothetical protein
MRVPRVEDETTQGPTENDRIVLGADDGSPSLHQLDQKVGHRLRTAGIELRRRLVEDEYAGSHGHDACDRHALLLAARKRKRLALRKVLDPQAGQDGVDAAVHLGPRHTEVLQAEGELLAHGELRSRQLVSWRREDDADPTDHVSRRRPDDRTVVDANVAAHLRPDDPWNEACRSQGNRRLSGARPSGNAEQLPPGDASRDVLERGVPPADVADAQRLDGQAGSRFVAWGKFLGHWKNPVAPVMTTTAISSRITGRARRSTGVSVTLR